MQTELLLHYQAHCNRHPVLSCYDTMNWLTCNMGFYTIHTHTHTHTKRHIEREIAWCNNYENLHQVQVEPNPPPKRHTSFGFLICKISMHDLIAILGCIFGIQLNASCLFYCPANQGYYDHKNGIVLVLGYVLIISLLIIEWAIYFY